jgi:hypothetical protein
MVDGRWEIEVWNELPGIDGRKKAQDAQNPKSITAD